MSYPPCSREYLPAYRESGTRDLAAIRWVVLHDGEAPTARGMAAYFKTAAAGGSAHLCVDDLECFRCLDNDVIPWGAASAFRANTCGLHIEQAGYAKWSAVVWRSHYRTLDRAAYKTAVHLHAFHLPVQFVTAAELPGERGVTTHREISVASRRLDPSHAWQYTHSDPGPLWPRRWFMRRVAFHHARL